MNDPDLLFKAIADPSRRKLLDVLHAHDGRTLGELCEHLAMARQSVTQHLGLLEAANLVTVQRRGREKLHFLNPVPLHDIYERWIRKFESAAPEGLARPQTTSGKRRAMNKSEFVYVTYIRTTPERLWTALTDPEFTAAILVRLALRKRLDARLGVAPGVRRRQPGRLRRDRRGGAAAAPGHQVAQRVEGGDDGRRPLRCARWCWSPSPTSPCRRSS